MPEKKDRMRHGETKLSHDVRRTDDTAELALTRRAALRTLGVGAAALLVACKNAKATSNSIAVAATASAQREAAVCGATPEETDGPFPDRLGLAKKTAFVRRDVTEGKSGLPLSLALSVVDASVACRPIRNARVDIWQCDKDGAYSEYEQPGSDQSATTFLRGTQLSDAAGRLGFDTIYPGWYEGRVTHIHIEVFVHDKLVKTTQMAFPDHVNAAVYALPLYAARGPIAMTNADDMVFSDGDDLELASLSGDLVKGFTATLQLGVMV